MPSPIRRGASPAHGGWGEFVRTSPGTIQPFDWYKVKVSLRDQHIRIELEKHVLFSLQDDFSQRGAVSLRFYNGAGCFRKIKVSAPDGAVLWEGPPDLPSRASRTSDSGPSMSRKTELRDFSRQSVFARAGVIKVMSVPKTTRSVSGPLGPSRLGSKDTTLPRIWRTGAVV